MKAKSFIKYGEVDRSRLPVTVKLISEWCYTMSTTLIYGAEKSGKSWFALLVALSLASGQNFNGYEIPEPKKVLYLSSELSLPEVVERCDKLTSSCTFSRQMDIICDNLILNDKDSIGRDLSDSKVQRDIMTCAAQNMVDVIIVDNIYTGVKLTPRFWESTYKFVESAYENGMAVILVCPANKKGELFGVKNPAYWAANVIRIQRCFPEGIDEDQVDHNIVIESTIEISRRGSYIDCVPHYLWLIDKNRSFDILYHEVSAKTAQKVNDLRILLAIYQGINTCHAISKAIGLSEGYTCKRLKVLMNKGFIIRYGNCYYPANANYNSSHNDGTKITPETIDV